MEASFSSCWALSSNLWLECNAKQDEEEAVRMVEAEAEGPGGGAPSRTGVCPEGRRAQYQERQDADCVWKRMPCCLAVPPPPIPFAELILPSPCIPRTPHPRLSLRHDSRIPSNVWITLGLTMQDPLQVSGWGGG